MSFQAPWWLLLLSLIPVIVALHLRRRRTLPVSSLYIWRRLQVESSSRSFSRVPVFSTLLVLQLLAVLLLTLALARPVFGHEPPTDHLVIVIDSSGSMAATDILPSRFEQAKLLAATDLERLHGSRTGSGARVSVLTPGRDRLFAVARQEDNRVINAKLSAIEPGFTSSDWSVLKKALNTIVREEENTHLRVYTDDVRAQETLGSVFANTSVLLLGESASNSAITRFAVSPLDAAPTDVAASDSYSEWTVSVDVQEWPEVRQDEPETAHTQIKIDFHFTPEGMRNSLLWHSEEVRLEDGVGSTSVQLSLPGAGTLEARLPDDGVSWDNQAYAYVYAEPLSLRTHFLGPRESPVHSFLTSHPYVDLTASESLPADPAAFDLVVIEDEFDVNLLGSVGTHTLYFASGTAEGSVSNVDIVGWQDHLLLTGIDSSQLQVARAQRVPLLPGAAPLLETQAGPLVQVRTTPTGHQVVASFMPEDSNWPQLLGFPTFFQNLLQWVEPNLGETVARFCTVGESCLVDPRDLPELLAPEAAAGGAVDLNTVEWLPAGIERAFVPQTPGVVVTAWDAFVVLPSDPRESVLPPVDPTPAGGVSDTTSALWLSPWVWLVLLALLVLVAETIIASIKREAYRGAKASPARLWAIQRRRWIGITLRTTAFVLLCAALLELPVLRPERGQHSVLVVEDQLLFATGDGDRGMDTGGDASDRVIHLAGSPRLNPITEENEPAAYGSNAEGDWPALDLEASMELAYAMLPSENSRIVVEATGLETSGDALRLLTSLPAGSPRVDVRSLPSIPEGEVLVETVQVPASLTPNQPSTLTAIIHSQDGGPATLTVLRDDEVWARQETEFDPGRNRVDVNLAGLEPGNHLFEIAVESETDVVVENNRYGAIARVREAPRIAIFTPQASWGQQLAQALDLQGLENAEVLPPSRIPHYLGHTNPVINSWLDYDLVFLMNVPAIDMQFRQQELLATWVKDHGGGLIVLGGENTFGPGGYYQTPLEEVLPLSTEIPQEKPVVAVSFVLDRSGSMRQAVGEVERLDIAREATLNAIDLLNEESLVSVIAFDSDAYELVPVQHAREQEEIRELLSGVEPGGGTAIYPGLDMAYHVLSEVDPDLTRHIVVMTDGLSQPGEFRTLLEEIRETGITVSTAAIGRGADVGLIEELARWGGGAAHITEDFQALPSILAQEALLLSDEPVQTETFVPTWGDRSAAFTAGLPDSLPPLHGHIMVTGKEAADVHLYGPDDTPLLATWRYGLGRVAALATHGAGTWSANWLDWPEYPRFMTQMARWALPSSQTGGTNIHARTQRDDISITVSVLDPLGAPRTGLQLSARVFVEESDEAIMVELHEQVPGEYVGSTPLQQQGAHRITVDNPDDEVQAETLVYVPYPERFRFTSASANRLEGLAQLTGGNVLTEGNARRLDGSTLRWEAVSTWRPWVLLALIVFILELLVRYVRLPRRTTSTHTEKAARTFPARSP